MCIRRLQYFFALLGILFLLFNSQVVSAGQLTWNGFASFYARKSMTKDVYETTLDSDRVDYSDGTRIGLNLRADIADGWSFIGQLLAAQRTLGINNNNAPVWSPEFDWAYVNYDPVDEINIRVGRQIYPSSITAEYTDVGLTYPWRRLPIQFYNVVLYKSFEGVSGSYQLRLGNQTLSLRLLGGGSRPNPELGNTLASFYQINNLSGASLAMEGDGWRVQATGTQYLYESVVLSGSGATGTVLAPIGVSRDFEIGGRYDKHNIVAYAEYMNSECGNKDVTCYGRAYYGTLGYHLGRFLPHYTYSFGENNWGGMAFYVQTRSHGFGLNYQINPSIVLKGEYLVQWGTDAGIGFGNLNVAGLARSASLGLDLVF